MTKPALRFRVASPRDHAFAFDVLTGLSKPNKTLSPRFLYDAHGSALFEEITRLPEYYPTRAEIEILNARARDIAARVAPGSIMVEFGSGSSRKTEILLEALPNLSAYLPIDVSRAALSEAKPRLAARFPALDIRPLVTDFTRPIEFPPNLSAQRRIGFFPGSTIGNSTPAQAARLLQTMRRSLGPGGRLIVGVDLKKDPQRLFAAYNDSRGVTAAFNLNLLSRINRELDGSFDLAAFRHHAFYNATEGRVEMHIVSRKDQAAHALGKRFQFHQGESIHTENSYKYALHAFGNLARSAGWIAERAWLDKEGLFSVHELATPRR